MADDLNSLLQANRSSSVLEGIANPPQFNPLAAQNSAVQAAHNMLTLRGLQAKEAAGQAYQGAINPETGEFDPNRLRTLLSQNPTAAMEAGATLSNTQNISSNQLEQARAKATWVNARSGAALESGDFSDGAMLKLFQEGMANGVLTLPEVQRQLALIPPDAAGRERWLREHQMTSASVQQQLDQTQGTRQVINTPQGTYVTTVPPIRSGQNVTVPHGATPGSTTTVSEPYDDQGIIPRDANGAPTRPPKGYTSVTKPVTAVPGVPTGGPPVITPGASPPGVPPPGTIPVTPAPGVTPGRITAPPGLGNPNKPTPAVATPAPAVATPAPAATPAPTVQPPAITAPPQGQPQKVEADVQAYTQDQAAVPTAQTRAQNMAHAYEALNQLKSATGKGAPGINALRSYAQTLGILPAGAVNEQRLIELVTKYTERAMIDAAGGSTTDMGRRMQEQANAGTLLSTPANLDILRSDMGKAIQNIAAYQAHPSKDGVGYLEHRAKIASTTDPRGFVWSLYGPEEQAKIMAEVKKDPEAEKSLFRAIGMADTLKLRIPGSSPRPPPAAPGKQSFLAPPTAAPQMYTGENALGRPA